MASCHMETLGLPHYSRPLGLDHPSQEINMVQELSYESCAMFPGRQSGFNMNIAYGYGQQSYGQEYSQFNIDPSCLPPGQPSTCAWAGVYPSTPTGASAANGRPASGNGSMEPVEWGQYSSSQVGSSSGSPQGNSGNLTYPYRGNIPADYPVSLHGSPPDMGGSPPPTQMQFAQNQGNQRQSSRPPYDWMKKQSYPSTPATGKTRTKDKYRVVYTDHQRLELEKEFHYSRYITIRRKAELAQNLNLSERQVKIWFQNRRAKERKQNKKREDAMQAGGAVSVKTELSPGTSGSSVTSPTAMTSPGMAHPVGLPMKMSSQPQSPPGLSPYHSHVSSSHVQSLQTLSHTQIPHDVQPPTTLNMTHMTSPPIHIMPTTHS